MTARIIVAVDGSALAERALPLAVYLARQAGADLRLIYAAFSLSAPDEGYVLAARQRQAEEYLAATCHQLEERHGVTASAHTAIADAAHLIIEDTYRDDAWGVVMATHGRTGLSRFLLGSVAEQVLRRSSVPVFLVPPGAAPRAQHQAIGRILVPLDGSDTSFSVVGPVTDLARRLGAEVRLLRVFDEDELLGRVAGQTLTEVIENNVIRLRNISQLYFAPIKAHLRAAGVVVSSEWMCGRPHDQILAMARRTRPDLIALATHGRSGISRLRYGSVAEALLHDAPVPVMVLGPAAIARALRAGRGEPRAGATSTTVPAGRA